tara:strand:- start:180 stop:704 length:525 start_codon:yes stop_codon:yes gene_type:complete
MNQTIKKYKNYILPVCLILVLSFSRIIPHPPNFTPILAVGIFSGFYFKNFIPSFFIVVFSMFLGDLFLGFHNTMFFTYTSLAAAVLIGVFIKNFKFKEVLIGGLASSVIFFVVTNFGVWALTSMYENNLGGLINSYLFAIPFFHNTLLSTLIYLLTIKVFFDLMIKKRIAPNIT